MNPDANAWTALVERMSLRELSAAFFPDRGSGEESDAAVSSAPTLPARRAPAASTLRARAA